MATIKNKLLFFTTSPRTPSKMIPEIKLLNDNFEDEIWNVSTQKEFMDKLSKSDFLRGKVQVQITILVHVIELHVLQNR